ncbi:jg16485 [Pararge aegeria aegeria]|uniref:Jg16485 protein n=1 Tax=Pararge aegeria aegeria TaxID=348720 RepID=A0A8S4RJ47_9NEOP|nr:jg16485 [Pararge aegeria aegeria]
MASQKEATVDKPSSLPSIRLITLDGERSPSRSDTIACLCGAHDAHNARVWSAESSGAPHSSQIGEASRDRTHSDYSMWSPQKSNVLRSQCVHPYWSSVQRHTPDYTRILTSAG